MSRPPLAVDQASAFIEALTGSPETPMTWQTFPDRKEDKADENRRRQLTRVLHGPLSSCAEQLRQLNQDGAGIFVTVNTTDLEGRASTNVTGLRAAFCDADSPLSRPLAIEPSFSVKTSPGRFAYYWSLFPGEPLNSFTPTQKRLATYYGSDPSVTDLPRVMRVPGFVHQKGDPVISAFLPGSGVRFTVSEVATSHPLPLRDDAPESRAHRSVAPDGPDGNLGTASGRIDRDRQAKLLRVVASVAETRSWAEGSRHASAKDTATHARKIGLARTATALLVGDLLERAGKTRSEADELVAWAWAHVEPDPDEVDLLRSRVPESADLPTPVAAIPDARPPDPAPIAEKLSLAQVLIRIGVSEAQLFHDDRDAPHAAIGESEARRIVPVQSSAFARFLAGRYYGSTGKVANGEAISSARSVLAYKAMFEGERHPLYNRFALHDGALWIDLANDRQEAVRVTKGGWTITSPPILFRRFRAQQALPFPTQSGDLSRLEAFVNTSDDEQMLLVKTWLVAAFLGHIPRPLLLLIGAQGAAKTTCAKVLRCVTDPSVAPTNRLSHHDDELALILETNAVPVFDNLTSVPARAADLLCQAVTGGGFSKRQLYTDSDEEIYSFRRAIIGTGINIPTSAPDLLDRALSIQLDRVPPENRRSEAAFWKAFEKSAPVIFAGALDTLATAMRLHPETEDALTDLPRMADFCQWAASASEAMGIGRERFLTAYQKNSRKQITEVMDSDPVARAIRELLEHSREWSGTVSELWVLFKSRHGDEMKTDSWPRNPRALSQRINVLHTTLAEAGIIVRRDREGSDGIRKLILCRGNVKVRESSTVASGASAASVPDEKAATDADPRSFTTEPYREVM